VNPRALASFSRLGHPRVNADFPEVLRNDPDSPVRSSDHDPVVAYFRFKSRLGLALSAVRNPGPARPTLTYTVLVSNAGPDAADQVVVSDPLPPGTTFRSVSAPAGWSCATPPPGRTGTLTCRVASLPRGAAATLTWVATVDCRLAGARAITNTATARSALDPDSGSPSATVTVTGTRAASGRAGCPW
jgi:uncharacterized repeat protein (TIGR01451 family)